MMLTVTDPAESHDLVSPEDCADALGIDAEDSALPSQITAASAMIEAYTGRVFVVEGLEETLTSVDSDAVIVSRFPVVSVDSVTEDGVELEASEYELDAQAGLIYRLRNDAPSVWFARSVVIEYSAGYETIPAAVESACIDLVRLRRSRASRDPFLKSLSLPEIMDESYWVGGLAVGEPGQGLPSDVRLLLSRFVVRKAVAA